MIIIGLTGASGSGKSTVSSIFSSFGVSILDADEIYADLLINSKEMLAELSSTFDVVENGQINKSKLRDIVFSDPECLNQLNHITHKYVCDTINKGIDLAEEHNEKMIILDIPMLFESEFDKNCDTIIGVIASLDNKIKRICSRDDINAENAQIRLKNQKNNDFFIKNCDIIIENNADFEMLKSICKKIYTKLGEQNGK